jgi:hypothetical protein
MVLRYDYSVRRLALVATVLCCMLGGNVAARAEKVPLDEVGDTEVEAPPGDVSAPDCIHTWSSPPRILVHMDNFGSVMGNASEKTKLLAAITDVVNEFNKVGATSASVKEVELSPAPIAYRIDGETFKNLPAVPTIHVGFTSDIKSDTTAIAGGVAVRDYDKRPRPGCQRINEVYLVFPGPNDPKAKVTWNYDTPFAPNTNPNTDAFYKAGPVDAAGRTWFRPVFLHELLHAFGFDHHDAMANYSFQNSRAPGGFPWANRPAEKSIRPLPFEVGELRKRYPGSGTRYDVAVLNTWFAPPKKKAEEKCKDPYLATQKALCKPSIGIGWADVTSSGPCGIDPDPVSSPNLIDEIEMCPGDKLRTSFTIANYSTAKMNVTATLWFSKDAVLNTLPEWQGQWKDQVSETRHDITIKAAESELQSVIWTVPSLDKLRSYQPIVRLEAKPVNDPTIVVSDWIPLRSGVLIKSCDGK